jgi:hypothetical protein
VDADLVELLQRDGNAIRDAARARERGVAASFDGEETGCQAAEQDLDCDFAGGGGLEDAERENLSLLR